MSNIFKKLVNKKLIIGALCLLVLAAGVTGTYYWQHTKVTDLQSSLSKSTVQLTNTKGSLADKTKQYNDLQAQYRALLDNQKKVSTSKIPTQEDLDLKVVQATTYRSGLAEIGIIITLTNDTGSTVAVSPTAYKVKDSDNHSFLMYSGAPGLGKNYSGLQSQTLNPGEAVTGAIGGIVADDAITNYTLMIGTHTYPFTATQL